MVKKFKKARIKSREGEGDGKIDRWADREIQRGRIE